MLLSLKVNPLPSKRCSSIVRRLHAPGCMKYLFTLDLTGTSLAGRDHQLRPVGCTAATAATAAAAAADSQVSCCLSSLYADYTSATEELTSRY